MRFLSVACAAAAPACSPGRANACQRRAAQHIRPRRSPRTCWPRAPLGGACRTNKRGVQLYAAPTHAGVGVGARAIDTAAQLVSYGTQASRARSARSGRRWPSRNSPSSPRARLAWTGTRVRTTRTTRTSRRAVQHNVGVDNFLDFGTCSSSTRVEGPHGVASYAQTRKRDRVDRHS